MISVPSFSRPTRYNLCVREGSHGCLECLSCGHKRWFGGGGYLCIRSVCNGQCDRYGNEQCGLKKGRTKHQDIRDGFIVVARGMLDACRFVENQYTVI